MHYILLIPIPYQGASLKQANHVSLDLLYNSAGAVDLGDFMDYPEDSPVPQSHHTQD